MSDQIPGPAPAEPTQPAATPAEPVKPSVPASALPEDALSARIAAAKATGKNELLKELGVTDPAQLKAALDSIKAAEEAKKTEAEKLAGHLAELERTKATLADATAAIESVWATESTKLTAEQLAAVDALGGQSSAAKVRALNLLRPTWVTPTAPPQAPAAPPATTSPAPNAPPTTTISPTDPKARHADLLAKNPVAAANYAAQHPEVFS